MKRTYILKTLDKLRILTEINKNPEQPPEEIRSKLKIPRFKDARKVL